MKSLEMVLSIFLIITVFVFVTCVIRLGGLNSKITKETYFEHNNKEYQCGLTPRQVEIDMLEERIKTIKGL